MYFNLKDDRVKEETSPKAVVTFKLRSESLRRKHESRRVYGKDTICMWSDLKTVSKKQQTE